MSELKATTAQEIVRNENNKTLVNSETINYCPMCGRKLKETK